MALKGDTSNLPLADIFQTLSQNQQTGILTLKLGAEDSRKILFAPAGITLLDARAFRASRFAHLLSVGGLAPRDRLDAAIQQIERLASDPLSSVTMLNDLVERRVVDRDAAMKLLVSEVREEIFEIFAQPHLEFEFDESDVPIEEIPKQCLFRTEEVVFEAARRIDEWQIIRSAISDLDEFYVSQPNARLRQEDEPILKSLDGSRTITDVAESLMRPRFEVARCVARLFSDDGVRLAGANELIEGARGLDPRAHSARIVRLLHRARTRMSKLDERLEEMAELYAAAGIPSAAVAVLLERADTMREQGDAEGAFALVLRAREFDPENLRVLSVLAELYGARGEKKAEIEVITRLAERHARAGNLDQAIDIAKRVAEVDPDSPLLDQNFPDWCAKAERRQVGATVLSTAVTHRSHPDRVAVLYEAILRLDPTRGDIRKQLAGLQKAKKKSRILWVAAITVAVAALAVIAFLVHSRMAEQRLQGRYDSATALVDKGEERLAEAELEAILAEASGGEIRANAERLLIFIRDRVEKEQREKRDAELEAGRVALQSIQADIEEGDLVAALAGLSKLEGTLADPSLVKLHELKRTALRMHVEEEHGELARLAATFKVPESDTDLAAVQGAYSALFARDRLDAYRSFAGAVQAMPVDAADREQLLQMARGCIASIERVRPGLDEVEARLQRNDELDDLSDDYEGILTVVKAGDFAAARDRFDALLGEYGEGPLRSHFEKQLDQVRAAADAVAEIHSLLEKGDAAAAHSRARSAAIEINNELIDFAATVGVPVRVATLPEAARLKVDGKDVGFAPADIWLKPDQERVVFAEAKGFEPRETRIHDDSPPIVHVDLPRLARFRVDLGASIDSAPLTTGTHAIVGGRDGVLYKLDLRDGSQAARHRSGSLTGISAPPLLGGGRVIVTLGEGVLQAVDLETFESSWEADLGGTLAGPPVLDGNQIFGAREDGAVYAVSLERGESRQIATVRGPLRCGPAVLGNVLAVGTTTGQVIGISLKDGHTVFATKEMAQPIVVLSAGSKLFLAADDAGLLRGLRPEDGTVAWERRAGSATAASAVEMNGLVLFAAGKQGLVLDAGTGDLRSQVESRAWISATPVMSGGRIYIGDREGYLNAFDTVTGTQLYRHQMKGSIAAMPLLLPDGLIVVSTSGEVTLLSS